MEMILVIPTDIKKKGKGLGDLMSERKKNSIHFWDAIKPVYFSAFLCI